MFTAAELQSLRALARSAMPDTGRVLMPATGGTLSAGGATWTPSAATVVYAGVMRVRPSTSQEISRLFGDAYVASVRHVAVLPFDAAAIAIGTTLVVDGGSDPQIAAVEFRVRAIGHSSYHVERTLALEVIEP